MATNPDLVRGTSGDDDLSANTTGQQLVGSSGDDILRGGKGDDILLGGPGDDQMWGGGGADQFRFYGDKIDGPSDTDRIYDLNFAEGDKLVFNNFNHLFTDQTDVKALNGGDSAIIYSYAGLAAADAASARITVTGDAKTDLLFVSFDNGNGQIETLRISHAFAAYTAAAHPSA